MRASLASSVCLVDGRPGRLASSCRVLPCGKPNSMGSGLGERGLVPFAFEALSRPCVTCLSDAGGRWIACRWSNLMQL